MTDNDPLHYNSETSTFKITEKGLRFPEICDHIGALIEENQI